MGNLDGGRALSNNTVKTWSSGCRCKNDECSENSFYEIKNITFTYNSDFNDGGTFDFDRFIYSDASCLSEVTEHSESGFGNFYVNPIYQIHLENGENYVLGTFLNLKTNMQLSANEENCSYDEYDEDGYAFNCEAGLVMIVDGQLLVDEGDNNYENYAQNNDPVNNPDEFEDKFVNQSLSNEVLFFKPSEDYEMKFPNELFKVEQLKHFQSTSDIDSFFQTNFDSFLYNCAPGTLGSFFVSGVMTHVDCGGDYLVYDFDIDVPGKMIESVFDPEIIPDYFYISKVSDSDEMLFVSNDASLLDDNLAGAELAMKAGNFNNLSGEYFSCLPNIESMNFTKLSYVFPNDTVTSGSITVTKSYYNDPECQFSPINQPPEVSNGSFIYRSTMDDHIKIPVFTFSTGSSAIDDNCIDKDGSNFLCQPGFFVSAGGYLILDNSISKIPGQYGSLCLENSDCDVDSGFACEPSSNLCLQP